MSIVPVVVVRGVLTTAVAVEWDEVRSEGNMRWREKRERVRDEKREGGDGQRGR